MVERNDQGKAARRYFIECERRAKREGKSMKLAAVLIGGLSFVATSTLAPEVLKARAAEGGAQCNGDLQCLADKYEGMAFQACQAALQDRVPQVELTHGFGRQFFNWQGVGSLRDQTVAYTGTAARVQIAGGTWQDLFYRCTFDPKAGTVTDLEIQEQGISF